MDWHLYALVVVFHFATLTVGVALGIALERWRLARWAVKQQEVQEKGGESGTVWMSSVDFGSPGTPQFRRMVKELDQTEAGQHEDPG